MRDKRTPKDVCGEATSFLPLLFCAPTGPRGRDGPKNRVPYSLHAASSSFSVGSFSREFYDTTTATATKTSLKK